MAQNVLPDEIIVVDNGSSDNTVKIVRKFSKVRLIKEKRRGIAYARDAGFNAAKSDYLGRIDADSVLPNEWVRCVKEFYRVSKNKDAALTGGATFRNMPLPRFAGWLQKQLAFRMSWIALGHHILWGSNMVVPKSAWQKVGSEVCHAPVIHEDIDMAIHMRESGVKIVYKIQLRVSTILKRVYSDQDKLWFNLKWWPRTLKRHGKKGWVVTLGAAGGVYVLAKITSWLTKERV